MKKLAVILLSLATLTGCYDDYVKDYDYSSVYMAYQCDLRTFVVGEGMEFKFGAALGGVMNNKRDRQVRFAIVDSLCTCDLAPFNGLDEYGQPFGSFTAHNVMTGASTDAALSQSYVTEEFKKNPFDLKQLAPLPRQFYTLSSADELVIKKGMHTGTVTVKADSVAFLSDPNTSFPYYAIGIAIESAEADTVLLSKSYEVIAVRFENMFFGNWYHGGVTAIVDDVTGETLSSSEYPTRIPGVENTPGIYTLTTEAYNRVKTNYRGNGAGSLAIVMEDGGLRVESQDDSVVIEDLGSSFNKSKLLQGRKLFLNFKYSNGDGTSTVVTDTLSFRNRIRDGVNEWQDENPEHYK